MREMVHSMQLAQVAVKLGGELRPADAGASLVHGVAAPAGAAVGEIVFAEDERALEKALASAASVVLVTAALASKGDGVKPLLVVGHPKLAFSRAAALFRRVAEATGLDPRSVVSPSARLDAAVSVGPFAVIGNEVLLGRGCRVDAGVIVGEGCVVGEDCHLYPRVVLYPGVRLGARVKVHAGAVLGSDGFGYVRDADTGTYEQFPQQGVLVIEDDVEIGANTTVDRGALGETRIARGTKLDNLVHVGHNVQVGADVVIAAQTGISGSSSIGNGAIVAGQVGIADHVVIGEGAILGAQCGVPSNKQIHGPGVLFWGTPARPIKLYLRELALLARLARGGRKVAADAGTGKEEG